MLSQRLEELSRDPDSPDSIAELVVTALGYGGSYYIVWKTNAGNYDQDSHGLPDELQRWLSPADGSRRDFESLQVILGPGDGDFFASDKYDKISGKAEAPPTLQRAATLRSRGESVGNHNKRRSIFGGVPETAEEPMPPMPDGFRSRENSISNKRLSLVGGSETDASSLRSSSSSTRISIISDDTEASDLASRRRSRTFDSRSMASTAATTPIEPSPEAKTRRGFFPLQLRPSRTVDTRSGSIEAAHAQRPRDLGPPPRSPSAPPALRSPYSPESPYREREQVPQVEAQQPRQAFGSRLGLFGRQPAPAPEPVESHSSNHSSHLRYQSQDYDAEEEEEPEYHQPVSNMRSRFEDPSYNRPSRLQTRRQGPSPTEPHQSVSINPLRRMRQEAHDPPPPPKPTYVDATTQTDTILLSPGFLIRYMRTHYPKQAEVWAPSATHRTVVYDPPYWDDGGSQQSSLDYDDDYDDDDLLTPVFNPIVMGRMSQYFRSGSYSLGDSLAAGYEPEYYYDDDEDEDENDIVDHQVPVGV